MPLKFELNIDGQIYHQQFNELDELAGCMVPGKDSTFTPCNLCSYMKDGECTAKEAI